MTRTPRIAAAAVLFCFALMSPAADHITHLATAAAQVETAAVDAVLVAPPTGIRDVDRASILAALERVRPHGTIQFAPGTYRVGGRLDVAVAGITLLGHPEGTTLRGCEPEEFAHFPGAVIACSALQLTGGHQTIRGFTFEYSWFGLHIGCCAPSDMADVMAMQTRRRDVTLPGGYLIEGNVFRQVSNGLYVLGESPEPTVIRGNRFVDSYHAVVVGGRTAHVLDNDISVPEPERVPFAGHAGASIAIVPLQVSDDLTSCAGNVVAGNRVEGHPDAIGIMVVGPGTACRDNVIRDNTVIVQRARFARLWPGIRVSDPSDSTAVGVPIGLFNLAAVPGRALEPGREPVLEGNRIENNRIIGAEGIGIEVRHGSRNHLVGNTISGVRSRDPFPGNTLPKFPGEQPTWGVANGAGIWLSPGSDENEITGNTFDDVASHAIVLEGDRNRVETRSAGDAVRDLGSGNRVERRSAGPASEPGGALSLEGEVETDDGVRLYYRVEGEGPDTVVVLHGGPSLGLAYLAPDLVPLARGRAVVHYDQRGIGRSSPLTDPERLSIERHVQDLETLRAHLGLERLALLGHSWGGMLAARYAAAHPHRVERILLLDPMAPARDPFMAMANARAQEMFRVRLDEPARARLDSLAATAEVADPGELCRERFSLLTRFFFEDPAARARSRADFCAGTPETMRNRPEVDAAILGSLGEWDVRPALGHVRSPVLVVRGAEGAIPLEAMEAWVEAFPDARLLTIEGAGHYPHVDRPEAFFPAADVFFGGGWPSADNHPAPVDSVDAFILGRMAELGIPGVSVAVLRGNEVLKLASYGRANLELDVPTSPSTAFPYASITKAFTGTAILRLVERNLLALDDRVGELLPGLPAAWAAVTVRQLLSHTSGLPDVARMEEAISNPLVLRNMLFASTRDSAMALLPTMPLSFEAARSVAYNQTNYMLLAMLLERLDGRTIEAFVREEFAQPLGLTSLVFGDSRAIMPGRASWYTRIDYSTGRPETVPVQPLWLEYPSFLYTTAGLNGSALDLARFVAAVASGDLLSEASRGEMWGNAQLADGSVARMGPYGVALGWLTDDRAGRSVWMGGAESRAVRYFVDEDLTVAVLTNLMGAGPYGLVDGAAKAHLAGERRVQ